jgi:ABC-type Fe3+-hydroxamate transport system substrate-binding protein
MRRGKPEKKYLMHPLIHLKKVIPVFLIGLTWFGLSSKAQAVVPAPDGGYPGGNTAEGQKALFSLTTGGYNTAVGWFSLKSDIDGSSNTAVGAGTLVLNNGAENTAVGTAALFLSTTGTQNTASGAFALFSSTTGAANTAVGTSALVGNTTGSGNIALGYAAGINVTTANNVTCIGAGVGGANADNSCFIGNIYGTTTVSGTALPVIVSDQGQLGTAPSSRRFKKDIKPLDQASEGILALKPVTFHYKSDKTDTPQFGLIAEDVAQVNPDLVVRDKNGEIYSVRYEQVNAMLLNEFLKEHKKVEQQQANITELTARLAKQEAIVAQQQQGMEALTAQVKEQAAQIQKVSAQFEMSKPAPQVVLNHP